MEKIAINVRNRLYRNDWNSKLYNQISLFREQCQGNVLTKEEIRQQIPFLRKEMDLSITNLRKIRREIRKEIVDMINRDYDYISDYMIAKMLYGLNCISYKDEGFKDLIANRRILFLTKYIQMVEKATETPKEVKEAMQNLILLE